QQTNAPPGNSGVGEYLETVPGAGGNTPIGKHGGGRSNATLGRGGALSPAAQRALDALGPDGKAAAGVAQQTAPGAATPGSGGAAGGGGSGAGGGSNGVG